MFNELSARIRRVAKQLEGATKQDRIKKFLEEKLGPCCNKWTSEPPGVYHLPPGIAEQLKKEKGITLYPAPRYKGLGRTTKPAWKPYSTFK